MPYIPKKIRREIDIQHVAETPGQLNYLITTNILEYLDEIKDAMCKSENNYADYNEVIGVLECIKLELYRKVISKYEDEKCKEEGDVY
jgi:hypothetical protein